MINFIKIFKIFSYILLDFLIKKIFLALPIVCALQNFRSPMGRLWDYGLFWYWQFLHQFCLLILQQYNLFELSIQSSLYCSHGTKYVIYSIIVHWVLCVCAHLRGLTSHCSQRAAQCNYISILISILVFPIKPHYMKLLLHASTQIQLSYLCICTNNFQFSFVPIDLPTVSVHCMYSILHRSMYST